MEELVKKLVENAKGMDEILLEHIAIFKEELSIKGRLFDDIENGENIKNDIDDRYNQLITTIQREMAIKNQIIEILQNVIHKQANMLKNDGIMKNNTDTEIGINPRKMN